MNNAEKNSKFERLVSLYLKRTGKAYSVEIGEAMCVTVSRAKSHLERMERNGLLFSWLERIEGKSMGRRYYDVQSEARWLTIALECGYEAPFSAKSSPALEALEKKGLIEQNPCYSYGVCAQWRVTRKAIDLST